MSESEQYINPVESRLSWQCQKCGHCCRTLTICLTHADIGRIFAFDASLHQTSSDWMEPVIPDESVASTFGDAPTFIIEGDPSILAVVDQPEGDCYFLKGNQCSIYPVRPSTCWFFPFVYDFDEHDKLEIVYDTLSGDTCPGSGAGEPITRPALWVMMKKAYISREEGKKYEFLAKVWNALVKEEVVEDTLENLVAFLIVPDQNRFQLLEYLHSDLWCETADCEPQR